MNEVNAVVVVIEDAASDDGDDDVGNDGNGDTVVLQEADGNKGTRKPPKE